MTLTLELTPDQENRLTAKARQRGQDIAAYLLTLAEADTTLANVPIPEEGTAAPVRKPNEAGLAALRQIAALKKGMPESDPSQTDQILREGRAGAMYDTPPAE